jgi:NAD(P)-dependent dehydrogenase (short-subunit alcohol dehydrogenase family)
MRDLGGRTAVVTGGASGIGRAMVHRFAAEGMNVVVADIDLAAAETTAAALADAGHRAVGIRTDVSRLEDIRALADATLEAFGAVHVVCNNAGVVVGGRVEELTDDEWRWVVDVDLWGAINGIRVFLPLIEAQGAGHVISTASTSGLVAPPFIAPYSVAKAGVIALMEALRRELDARQSPIGASVLVPGPVDTPLLSTSSDRAETGKDPADVAALVVDAIRENRFWILTHPEWGDVLRRRVDAIATTGMLTDRPGA